MRNKYCYINSGKKQYEFSSRSKKEEKIFAKLQSCGSQNALNCANLKFDLKNENLQSSLVQRKTIDTIREQTLLPHPINENNSNDANRKSLVSTDPKDTSMGVGCTVTMSVLLSQLAPV